MFASIGRLAAIAALAVALSPAVGLTDDDPVVARLNDVEIRESDVLRARGRLPASLRDMPKERIVPLLTDIVIASRLLADEARKRGIAYEPEVREQIDMVTDLVLEQELLSRELEDELTEADVRARYDELVAETENREQVRASHILLKEKEDAEAVIEELDEGGDFAELAKERSVGPSAEAGGDLGYFTRSEMAAPFSEAAFALEPGQYTREPAKTKFGWHVILVEDRRSVQPPPFDQVREQIRTRLAAELRADYVEDLIEDADLERFDR